VSTPERRTAPRRRRSRTSQSIIGFTEAELGLFLALLFFGLSLMNKRGTAVNATLAAPRAVAAAPLSDTTDGRNPRLAQLLDLSRKLDSLDRVVRAAYSRDSVMSARVARLQRQRDSLTAINLANGLGGGARAASQTAGAASASNAKLTAVEREMALAQLSRNETATALGAANQRADAARRELDALAPSVSRFISPTNGAAGAVAASAGAPIRPAGAGGTPGTGLTSNATPITAAGANGAGAASPMVAPSAALAAALRDTMAILRAIAAAPVPPSAKALAAAATVTGSPGSPGSGGGGGGGFGGGPATLRSSRILGNGIGNGTGQDASGPGRSRQTPTCIELKIDTGSVAEVLIAGADRYTVRGVTGSLETLLKTLQLELATSKKYTCRHNLTIRTAPNLAVNDYIFALNALLPYFNTELARPDGSR